MLNATRNLFWQVLNIFNIEEGITKGAPLELLSFEQKFI